MPSASRPARQEAAGGEGTGQVPLALEQTSGAAIPFPPRLLYNSRGRQAELSCAPHREPLPCTPAPHTRRPLWGEGAVQQPPDKGCITISQKGNIKKKRATAENKSCKTRSEPRQPQALTMVTAAHNSNRRFPSSLHPKVRAPVPVPVVPACTSTRRGKAEHTCTLTASKNREACTCLRGLQPCREDTRLELGGRRASRVSHPARGRGLLPCSPCGGADEVGERLICEELQQV